LRISSQSRHSARTVRTKRSAIAFAFGARIGVRTILICSLRKTSSKGPVYLLSRSRISGQAQAMTAADATRFGDVGVVSVPFGRYCELPTEAVAGKVVIDTNNYYPQRDGHFEELDSDRTTSSELLQAHLRDARVVKAFNAIQWMRLRDDGRPAGDLERLGIPISGDDEEAKRTVAGLIDQLGFDPVDAGTLAEGGRKHQTGAPAYTQGVPTAELRARLAT
jgi:8-hydroxy-5-deazaflavin:NADPH oxidoreductase